MKNYTIKKAIFIAVLLFVTVVPQVKAQATVDDVVTLQNQYQTVLLQLITLLQQQLSDLVAQLKIVQDSQTAVTTQLQQQTQVMGAIQQNTTITPKPAIIVPMDKSEILISNISIKKFGDQPGESGDNVSKTRYITLDLQQINSEGEYIKKPSISRSFTKDGESLSFVDTSGSIVDTNDSSKYGINYRFDGLEPGMYTITFTSGNLTKTITINVQ